MDQSIYADGPEVEQIREAARKHCISVSIGFSEKARHSEGTLWNSNLVIDETGAVKVHHRKLMPTFFEKLTWGNGDGHGLRTTEIAVRQLHDRSTGTGNITDGTSEDAGRRVKVGALICGENTNPLARYAVMSQGEHVHISTWPAVWPTRMPRKPKATDSSSTDYSAAPSEAAGKKNYNNILANRIRAGAHCCKYLGLPGVFRHTPGLQWLAVSSSHTGPSSDKISVEAKCFGIMCAAHFSRANLSTLTSILDPSDTDTKSAFEYALQDTSQAASMFLDPTGTPVPAFVISDKGERLEKETLRDEEGVLFAALDLSECIEGKQFHDVVGGGYQRFDVFDLMVDRTRKEPVTFKDAEEKPQAMDEGELSREGNMQATRDLLMRPSKSSILDR